MMPAHRPSPLSRAAPYRLFTRAWPAFVVAALAVAAPARADDWSTPGLDAAHTRLAGERSGATFSDGRWVRAAASAAGALASPVVADGFVVAAELDGTVRALAADTGAVVWHVALGSSVQGTPAIAGGRVFVPTLAGNIVALSLADGMTLWSTPLGGLTVSSPAIVGTDLIVGAGLPQQFVARLDGTTGAIVWRSLPVMEEFSNTAPAVAGGLAVFGTNGGHYYAFDVAAGLARWDYQADGIVNIAAPLIVAGRVYLAGGQSSNRVHAVNAATGAALPGWPIELPAPEPDIAGTEISRVRSVSSFAAAGGLIVLSTRLDQALDTDGNGAADQVLARESAIALDPTSGAIAWQHPIARVVFSSANDVPAFAACPTPAAFGTDAGTPLLAVASSVTARVSILEATTGADDADLTVAGRALGSPVMANGRLITMAENGTVEAQLSSVNHPPAAPVLAANPRPLDAADVTLHWSAAMDPDGEQPAYELRIDSDGEVLLTHAQQIFPGQGVTSSAVTAPLAPGVTYTVAVRARDPHGALSSWSAPETFTVAETPAVTVNGTPAASLRAAVAGAQAGDFIVLGAGSYPLSDTLHVAGGVSMRGAGAGRTTIDAMGLAVGITFAGTDPKSPTVLDKTTVTGAATCVAVGDGATGVLLSHLVVRDCPTAGIRVGAGGGATIVNGTVVTNGIGVDATGITTIKNSLVAGNTVGLASEDAGDLASSYDDVFGNNTDYRGLAAGTGDLAVAVTFVDLTGHNLMLSGVQPSTDRGDPADAVGEEPTPNGGRINLGAFGGTADAELSAPTVDPGQPGSPTPTTSPPAGLPPGQTPGHQIGDGGCAVGGGAGHSGSGGPSIFVLAAIVIACRRSRARSRS